MSKKTNEVRKWITDLVVGGGLGAVAAAIAAVNLILVWGVDQGYEASLRDVFDNSLLLGVLVVALLVAGPLTGLLIARRRRSAGRPAKTVNHPG
jgi:hypothetical protein